MQTHPYSNRLIHETSPYLLQHAHNPVDWYPWCDEAFERAKAENKPVLVSIGYAACHWCHVMEKESFEDEETAAFMNKYFINIKIDREERPDLDHIYMDALTAMTGSGGWPLNMFLTPEAKPFYGGTYFPPVKAYNRMSWKDTLASIHEAFTTRRDEIEAQANNLTEHIEASNSFGMSKPNADGEGQFFSKADLQTMAANLLAAADKQWGGFGRPPKFPQTFSIQYLLRHHYFTADEASLQHALLSLDKMVQGGIYDQLGGGFARYSTDEKWLAPHFEKMLYDNALLISMLSDAYQLTGQAKYQAVIEQTVAFVEREMMQPDGGFYSAIDADSEGVEGKFYTWSQQEIAEVLGEDADLFCLVYNVSEQGNWEHTNILWLPSGLPALAERLGTSADMLEQKMSACREKLLRVREARVRPQLDDKVLLGWNALMISALCKGAAATGNQRFLDMATRAMAFLENRCRDAAGEWHHTWKNGIAKFDAFLDDYAFLVQAYLQLSAVTGNPDWLQSAKSVCQLVIDEFSDEGGVFFLFTGKRQQDVIVRKKEVYDGATPSGNAVMAENLLRLSVYFDIPVWKNRGVDMLASLKSAVLRYPSSFGVWATLAQGLLNGFNEIAIVGAGAEDALVALNRAYIPDKIIMASASASDRYPLLRGKESRDGGLWLYLCKDYSCKKPVKTVEELILLLNENNIQ